MRDKNISRPHATIELVPDAEERFERAVQKLLKRPPIHRRNGKLADADQPKSGRGRPRKHDTTS